MKTSRLLILILCAFMALTGCRALLDGDRPAPGRWWLQPLAAETAPLANVPALDLRLEVVPGLDTERILILEDNARLNHFSTDRWADNLPDVLRSVMRRSLAGSGLFTVAPTGDSARCQVTLEVSEFFVHLDRSRQPHEVHVAIAGTLNCGSGSRSLDVSETARVSGAGMAEVVAAFQRALDAVTRSLLAGAEGHMH